NFLARRFLRLVVKTNMLESRDGKNQVVRLSRPVLEDVLVDDPRRLLKLVHDVMTRREIMGHHVAHLQNGFDREPVQVRFRNRHLHHPFAGPGHVVTVIKLFEPLAVKLEVPPRQQWNDHRREHQPQRLHHHLARAKPPHKPRHFSERRVVEMFLQCWSAALYSANRRHYKTPPRSRLRQAPSSPPHKPRPPSRTTSRGRVPPACL